VTGARRLILRVACAAAMALLLIGPLPGVGVGVGVAAAETALPDTPLADPALEARARKLMADVRCVVCQAQSIAESDAGIAADMRRLIRGEIAAGKSDDEIRRYLADRYGDFVLFKPPFKAATWLLWAGPFLLLGLGAVVMVMFFRQRASPQTQTLAQAGLSAEERRRVAEALRGPAQDGTRPGSGSGS